MAVINIWNKYYWWSEFKFLNNYIFKPHVIIEFSEKTGIVDKREIDIVIKGLKYFFALCLLNKNNKQSVDMPSKYVDELWHAFILDTNAYTNFCNAFYGRLIHHNPAKAIQKESINHIKIESFNKILTDNKIEIIDLNTIDELIENY